MGSKCTCASLTPHFELDYQVCMDHFQATLCTISRLFYHRNGVWADVLSKCSEDVCSCALNAHVLTVLGAVAEGAPQTSCRDTESRNMSGVSIDHKHTQGKQWVAQCCTYAHKPPLDRGLDGAQQNTASGGTVFFTATSAIKESGSSRNEELQGTQPFSISIMSKQVGNESKLIQTSQIWHIPTQPEAEIYRFFFYFN